MTHLLRLCLAPTTLALLLACPQAQPGPTAVRTQTGANADDPRVVVDTGDLYASRSPNNPEGPPAAEAPAAAGNPSPGTGRPDETNGVCRLYAPELRDPACCEHTLGFDVKATQTACGLPVYLGESFHNSCGFYFMREANAPAEWLRITTIRGDTPQQAAEEHVLLMRRTDPKAAAEAFPGIAGAYWVRQDEHRWAFLPGWKTVRILAWKATGCNDEAIAEVARQLVATPEAPGAPRDGLIPVAAKTTGAGP